MPLKSGRLRKGLRNTSVGVSAIPDSATNHYPTDAGSGTTLVDAVGSADGSINGAAWQSGVGNGGYYLLYDGTDDFTRMADGSAFDNDTLSWMLWFRPDDVGGSERAIHDMNGDSDSQASNSLLDYNVSASGELRFSFSDATNAFTTTATTTAITNGTWAFAAQIHDQSSGSVTAYLANQGDSSITEVGSATYNGLNYAMESVVHGAIWDGSSSSRNHDGGIDDALYAVGTVWSAQTIEDHFLNTKGNYA